MALAPTSCRTSVLLSDGTRISMNVTRGSTMRGMIRQAQKQRAQVLKADAKLSRKAARSQRVWGNPVGFITPPNNGWSAGDAAQAYLDRTNVGTRV